MTWIRKRPLGLVYRDDAQAFGGYTLYSHVRGHRANLIDEAGRIVHQWQHPDGLQHVRLLPNGHLLAHTLPPEDAEGAESIGGSAASLVELDQHSNVVWEHRDPYLHHDFQRLANGNTLVVRWAKLPFEVADRVQGGHRADADPDWMWADTIREIDPAGATVRDWYSWEHLNTAHHVKCPLESRKEWSHLNSLELTDNGDWLVSFRLTDTIAIVDHRTGALRWRWGPGQLSHQHHATWLEGGRILVFDNGCHRREAPSFSRILEIDRKTRKIAWSYQAEPILAFFSFMISGCERLANGNTLITEGATGRLFEITAEGETVWEYVSPWLLPSTFGVTAAVFRAYRIPTGDTRLEGLKLSPARFRSLNAAVRAQTPLGAQEDGVAGVSAAAGR